MTADARGLRVAALQSLVSRMPASVDHVRDEDPELGDRLHDRLEKFADTAQRRLADVAESRSARPAEDEAAGQDLVAEWLSFLSAAAVRRMQLDDGLTRIAERWLDQLSARLDLPEVALVVPSTTEFTGMVSQVVRLRLPAHGLWGLPVAVHEYGHFVAATYTRRDVVDGVPTTVVPVEDLLHEAAVERPVVYMHGHELFADALAASVAGPAYTAYCLRYRFDPAAAQNSTGTHPAQVRRVRVQLAVLDALAKNDPGGFLQMATSGLRKRWGQLLEGAGVKPDPDPDADLDPLEERLARLVLDEDRLRRVQYGGHQIARQLAEAALRPAGDTPGIAHVLNGAWSMRALLEGGALAGTALDAQLAVIDTAARALVEQEAARG